MLTFLTIAIYPAKEFRIRYTWQHWRYAALQSACSQLTDCRAKSDSKLAPILKSKGSNLNTVYSVPGDDSDVDSDDDHTYQPSILNVDGNDKVARLAADQQDHKGPGYNNLGASIPISQVVDNSTHDPANPAGDNRSSKIPQMNGLNESVPTSRDSAKDKTTDYITRNRVDSRSLGSSQNYPIDLEKIDPPKHHESPEESDDEGPEALPINQSSEKPIPETFEKIFGYSPSDVGQSSAPKNPSLPTNERSTTNLHVEDTSDSESYMYQSESDSSLPNSPDHSRSSPDSDSTSNHSSQPEDTYSSNGDTGLEKEPAQEMYNVGAFPTRQLPELLPVEDLNGTPSKVNAPNQPPCIEVEDSQLTSIPQARNPFASTSGAASDSLQPPTDKPIQRAPSPSDAALARPIPIPSHKYPPAPVQSHASLPQSQDSSLPWSQSRVTAYRQGTTINETPTAWTGFAPSPIPGTVGMYTQENCFGEIDRGFPRYDYASFSSWNRYDAASRTNHSLENSNAAPYYPRDDFQSAANPYPHQYEQSYWYTDPPGKVAMQADHNMLVSEKNESKTSKLPISDIVNDSGNSRQSMSRGLKRKAEEMGSLGATDEANDHQELENASASQDTQESALPDAQPRENIVAPETSLPEVLEPIADTTSSGPSTEQGRFTRKRVKLSSNGSRPVRAFVSGVLVGCMTLAGACAAFIATIPDAVREEAVHECF